MFLVITSIFKALVNCIACRIRAVIVLQKEGEHSQ